MFRILIGSEASPNGITRWRLARLLPAQQDLVSRSMGDGQVEWFEKIEKGKITDKEIFMETELEKAKSSNTVVSNKDKQNTNIASIRV